MIENSFYVIHKKGDKPEKFISYEHLTIKINIEIASRQGKMKIETNNKERCKIMKAEIETLKDILYLINNVE